MEGGCTACRDESGMLNLVKIEPRNPLVTSAPVDPRRFEMSQEVFLGCSPSKNHRTARDRAIEWRRKGIKGGRVRQYL